MGVALILGCKAAPQPVVRVVVQNPDSTETPGRFMVITYYPYDVDSILRQLEVKSKVGPRPHTKELDSLFAAFRPYSARFFRLSEAKRRLEEAEPKTQTITDSLAKLQAELP